MAEDNQTTATDSTDATATEIIAPAADDTTSVSPPTEPAETTESTPAKAEDSLSATDLAMARLLLNDRGGAAQETEQDDETVKPAKGETAAPAGDFDRAAMVESFVEHMGEPAKAFGEQVAAQFERLDQRIAGLAEANEALTAENAALRGDIEPVKSWAAQAQTQEQQRVAGEVHGFFDKQDAFSDRYGKGDPASHSPEQRMAREAVFGTSKNLLDAAVGRGMPMSRTKALALAQAVIFGEPTNKGATDQVRGEIKKAARGISVDPVRGGNKSGAALTPEQEQADRYKTVRTFFKNARK